MTGLPDDFFDGFSQEDPTDRLIKAQIAPVEEKLLKHQWTLELHHSFAGLKEDERFKQLMAKMAEHRDNLLERLAVERTAPLDQIRWFQAYVAAMSYFMQLSHGDPEEVKKAKLELPHLTAELAHLRSLLHVPAGIPAGRGEGRDSEDGSAEG